MEKYRGISGPWKVSLRDVDLQNHISTDWNDGDGVEQFATVWGDNESYRKTAKLIAADPELLEALQGMLKPFNGVTKGYLSKKTIEQAEAAINKAIHP